MWVVGPAWVWWQHGLVVAWHGDFSRSTINVVDGSPSHMVVDGFVDGSLMAIGMVWRFVDGLFVEDHGWWLIFPTPNS